MRPTVHATQVDSSALERYFGEDLDLAEAVGRLMSKDAT
jgi:hypothetical protein